MISLIFPIAFNCAAALISFEPSWLPMPLPPCAGRLIRRGVELALRLLTVLRIGIRLTVGVRLAFAIFLRAFAGLSLTAFGLFVLGRLLVLLRCGAVVLFGLRQHVRNRILQP